MAEEIEMPEEKKQEQIVRGIDPKWIVALVFMFLSFFFLNQHGAFGALTTNQLLMVGGVFAAAFYILMQREKPISFMRMDKAIRVIESWCKWMQKENMLPAGAIKVAQDAHGQPKIKLQKANNKPLYYWSMVSVIDYFTGINYMYLAKLDPWTGNLLGIYPKPENWSPEEEKDYFTVVVPSERMM